MELSEEEKKAIEYLKYMGKNIDFNKIGYVYGNETIEQILLEYRNVMEENETLKNLHMRDVEHLENLSKMCILKSTIKEELNQYENRLKILYERQEYKKIKLLNERIFALKKIIDENGDLLL